MKRIYFVLLFLFTLTNVFSQLAGTTWKVAPVAGSLGVGPHLGDTGWWSIDAAGVTARACFFDDTYVFNADGSFQNVLDGSTWIEPWQGGGDACGTPVAPHDGSGTATWVYDANAGTITVNGTGAYLGLQKVHNNGELASPNDAVSSITYPVVISGNTMTIDIDYGGGVWHFVLEKEVDGQEPEPSLLTGTTWKVAPMAGALGVGPHLGDIGWWSIDAAGVTARACFFDDTYVFNADGSFQNVLGADTWIEVWQGGGDACGTPVAPHDGSSAATWAYDATAGTVTLSGTGAYLGLPKVHNGGELTAPSEAVSSITYPVVINGNTMTIDLDYGGGVWHFVFEKCVDGQEPEPEPVNPIAFPLDFECEFIEYRFTEFEGAPTILMENPAPDDVNGSAHVQRVIKASGSATYAGSFIDLDSPIDFSLGMSFTIKVYSTIPETPLLLQLESGGTRIGVESTTTVVDQWEVLTFDFTGTTVTAQPLDRLTLIFDNGTQGTGEMYYFDDIIQVGGATEAECQMPTSPGDPVTSPPMCDNVISIFSGAYTDITGTNLNPDWNPETGVKEVMIGGDNILEYSNFDFEGIQLSPSIDVSASSGMTHLHVDVWSPTGTTLDIFPISDSPVAEKAYTLSITPQQWNSFDIPLTAFANDIDLTDIFQFKFANGDSDAYFVDNLYFYGDCNEVPACPQLVWSDEFDGTSLDPNKWEAQLGDGSALGIPGWGNNELQYYQAENATVANSILTITAKEESVGGRNYTSARLRTIGLGDFTYGRFEASIKQPIGQGIWSAFWMLPTDEVYGGWPNSGEIDIMEYLGHEPENVFGTIHYAGPNGNLHTGAGYRLANGGLNEAFHEYAIEWDENEIRWYIDDILYSTKTAADIAPDFWPFNQDFHLLLNLAVGGTLPGNPDENTTFPQKMEVEYVRVYEGQFPYLAGNNIVPNQARGEVYTIKNSLPNSSYTWDVPPGATIVSGQGTNEITVNWGGVTTSGMISVTETNSCMGEPSPLAMAVRVDIDRVDILECSIENFDTEAYMTPFDINNPERGDFVDGTTNPTDENDLVGKYTRRGATFDNIQFTTSIIPDARPFVTGDKTFYMDFYTTAPVGTTIVVQLENTAKATGNFPLGRHSSYVAFTTVRNAWERLVFKFDSRIDGSTTDTEIDKVVFLFDPNSSRIDTYYFDDFEKRCTSSPSECAQATICPPTAASCAIIPKLVASICPNEGYERMIVRDANNKTCSGFIDVPECSDGSLVDISFETVGPNSGSFELVGRSGDVIMNIDAATGTGLFAGVAATAIIPTMSQWGLLIFGLLVLNLGLIFIRRKELAEEVSIQ